MNTTQSIYSYHPLLISIAQSMVDTLEDAEDIVQEVFLKYLIINPSKIQNVKSYLIKSVTNSCLNHIKLNKLRSMQSLEVAFHLNNEEDVDSSIDLDHKVKVALTVLHRKLDPLEKAVYIFREVLSLDYDDIQDILEKKKDHCRQLFCRAKSKLRHNSKKVIPEYIGQKEFADSFKKACNWGTITSLFEELSKEISAKLKKPF